MDFTELQHKSEPELQRLLASLRDQLRDRRFKVAAGQHKDVRDLRSLKRDIARLLTRLHQLTVRKV